jgi:hypothetical protein
LGGNSNCNCPRCGGQGIRRQCIHLKPVDPEDRTKVKLICEKKPTWCHIDYCFTETTGRDACPLYSAPEQLEWTMACDKCGSRYTVDAWYQPCPKCGAPWQDTYTPIFEEINNAQKVG